MIRLVAWNLRCATSLKGRAAKTLAGGASGNHEARPEFTLAKVTDTFFALLQAALAGGVANDRLED